MLLKAVNPTTTIVMAFCFQKVIVHPLESAYPRSSEVRSVTMKFIRSEDLSKNIKNSSIQFRFVLDEIIQQEENQYLKKN